MAEGGLQGQVWLKNLPFFFSFIESLRLILGKLGREALFYPYSSPASFLDTDHIKVTPDYMNVQWEMHNEKEADYFCHMIFCSHSRVSNVEKLTIHSLLICVILFLFFRWIILSFYLTLWLVQTCSGQHNVSSGLQWESSLWTQTSQNFKENKVCDWTVKLKGTLEKM